VTANQRNSDLPRRLVTPKLCEGGSAAQAGIITLLEKEEGVEK
jgi:hypothetical protein